MKFPVRDIGIVVVAAGGGIRFGRSNKLFAKLAELPVFAHSVRNFHKLCPPENFVLVVKKSKTAKFADALRESVPDFAGRIVSGGRKRMDSVMNGLLALPKSAEFAAIHDAARPLASPKLLLRCLSAARKHGGAATAKRVTDTIKNANTRRFIVQTIDRSNLWRVETPQIFRTKDLVKAYQKAFANKIELTDDAVAMENAGLKAFLVEDLKPNIKITYPPDLKIAEVLLKT